MCDKIPCRSPSTVVKRNRKISDDRLLNFYKDEWSLRLIFQAISNVNLLTHHSVRNQECIQLPSDDCAIWCACNERLLLSRLNIESNNLTIPIVIQFSDELARDCTVEENAVLTGNIDCPGSWWKVKLAQHKIYAWRGVKDLIYHISTTHSPFLSKTGGRLWRFPPQTLTIEFSMFLPKISKFWLSPVASFKLFWLFKRWFTSKHIVCRWTLWL